MESITRKELITVYDKETNQPVHVVIEKKIKNNEHFNMEREYMCSICGIKFMAKKGTVIVRGHRTKGAGIRYYCVKCADIVGMWKNR